MRQLVDDRRDSFPRKKREKVGGVKAGRILILFSWGDN